MTRLQRLVLCLGLVVLVAGFFGYRLAATWEFRRQLDAARASLDRGEPAIALRALRPLVERGGVDGELCVLLARAYRFLGEPQRSLVFTEQALVSGYQTDESVLEHGLALAAVGRFNEAEPFLATSTTKDAAAGLASIYLARFEMQKALDILSVWKQLDPEDPMPYVLTGSIWVRGQDHPKAVEQFRQACELDRDWFEPKRRLAESLIELGELKEAGDLLRECHEADPQDPMTTLHLATVELETANVAGAQSHLEQLVKDFPNMPAAHVELAKLDLSSGKAERAARLLDRAIQLDPFSDSAHYNLALALNQLGQPEKAATHMARSRELQQLRRRLNDLMDRVHADPADIEAFCLAGDTLIELGQAAQAAELFNAVLAREPQNPAARAGLNRLAQHQPQER